jgi:2-phospho-L-lactate guanylyltransferase
MPSLNVVIPVKNPDGAKQRLGGLLSPDQRTGLALLLFERVLRTFSCFSDALDMLVVTDSQHVAQLAERYGAQVLIEEQAEGETTAVNRASAWSIEHGYASQLVVPGDMASLDPDEIRRLLEHPREHPSVILCPATGDDGTNALLCTPPDVIPYRFGKASFPEYNQRAEERGVPCHVLRLPSFALDLDTPDDIRAFLDTHPTHPGARLLEAWQVSPTS